TLFTSSQDSSFRDTHEEFNNDDSSLSETLSNSFVPEQTDMDDYTKKKKEQPFRYYLCFDVEATCEEGSFNYMNEIIEFPVLLIDSHTFDIIDVFHSYVKPSVNPVLSNFCTQLTGILQETVDASPSFPEMLCKFQEFLHRYQLFNDNTCAFITDGPWDIKNFVRKQCKISNITLPSYFALPWVNIRLLFSTFYNVNKENISGMLARYGLKFEGREHSGIDDAKNLAIIAKKLWEDGAVLETNQAIGRRTRMNF
ncbi:3551_t:CDS:2, partial [Acaulospora morrowiae]